VPALRRFGNEGSGEVHHAKNLQNVRLLWEESLTSDQRQLIAERLAKVRNELEWPP
jgi:hypothetical protein